MSKIDFDAIVVGGGPSGATAAADLARIGHTVLLLDRAGRIKPCGGAVPPRLMEEFAVPESLLVARARSARMVAPSDRAVDMPVGEIGYVGMVDRDVFDEWLRARAAKVGAERRTGTFERIERDGQEGAVVVYRESRGGPEQRVRAKVVIGADGARSAVARDSLPGSENVKCVFAYHEIIKSPPATPEGFDGSRCDVIYQGRLSPDFYAWVFPTWRNLEHRRRQRAQGLFPARCGPDDARRNGADQLRNHPQRRRADPSQAFEALGQWPRCDCRGRCCRDRGAGFG